MGALAWKLPEPTEAERRHNQRVEVRLLGRFMRSDRKEFDCESIDASVNGIAFASDAGVQFGERIVAYLNQIGRVEGRVARIFPGGFAIFLARLISLLNSPACRVHVAPADNSCRMQAEESPLGGSQLGPVVNARK
jgi:hypothetical protein